MKLFPERAPPGPARDSFWKSPVRGPWMTAILGSLLLPLVVLVGFTGFMSHAAYNPNLGMNQVVPRDGDLDLLLFDWPTGPTWLYALNQSLHTIVGIVVVPLVLAKLTLRGRGAAGGEQGFPVNKTAAVAQITPEKVGPDYRLTLNGASSTELTRKQLEQMPQHTESLKIACVEGWTTRQTRTGIRLVDLARMAGMKDGQLLQVISLQESGAFRQTTLLRDQVMNPKSLLALQVNGEDLSMDHGFPARIIVPAQPGVHNTKWVTELKLVNA